MNFKNCLYRELLWWLRSPSLWWCLPPLIISITLMPLSLITSSKMSIAEMEELWTFGIMSYKNLVKPMLESNMMAQMFLGGILEQVEIILFMPINELWQVYLLPPIQIWGILPLSMMVSPLAIALFNRDRNNGFYKEWFLNKGNPFLLLFSRLFVCGIFLFVMYFVSCLIYLKVLSHSSGRPDLFNINDNLWFYGVICGGFLTGLLTVVMSWYACLFSRNGSTEIYTGLLASEIVFVFVIFIIQKMGWSLQTMLIFNACTFVFTVLSLIPLGYLIKREKFLFN